SKFMVGGFRILSKKQRPLLSRRYEVCAMLGMTQTLPKFPLFRGHYPLALYYPGGVKSLTPFARLCFPFPPFIPRLKKGLPR
ncbi:MAG: hypothetical protein PUD60_07095, partial [Akkermansia muciniphila]|nr:hypothetical protein [Akkermansia muciniphila]